MFLGFEPPSNVQSARLDQHQALEAPREPNQRKVEVVRPEQRRRYNFPEESQRETIIEDSLDVS